MPSRHCALSPKVAGVAEGGGGAGGGAAGAGAGATGAGSSGAGQTGGNAGQMGSVSGSKRSRRAPQAPVRKIRAVQERQVQELISTNPLREAVTTFTAIRTGFNATRVRSPRSWFSEFFLAGRSQRSQRASGIASPRPVPKSLRRRAGIAERAVRGRDTSSTLVDRAA